MYDFIFLNSHPVKTLKIRGLGPYALVPEIEKIGMSVYVIDFVECWKMEDLEKLLRKIVGPNTKYLGLSITWSGMYFKPEQAGESNMVADYLWNGNLEKIKDIMKEYSPELKVLVGGSKATGANKRLGDKVDHIFQGFSETQLIDFLKSPEDYGRVINHDKEGWAKHTGFDFAKANPKFPKHALLTPNEVVPIECARGCPFKCKFCSFPLIGMKDAANYIRHKEFVRDQFMYNYETFGIQKYSIQDDTFNDTLDKVKLYAEVAQSLPFKIYFWCYIRADLLVTQPEQISLLHEMGLTQCWMGIETYNREAGRVVGKGLDPNRIKDMLYKAAETWGRDVFISQGYIVGLPGENRQSVTDSYNWLMREDSPIDMCMFTPLGIRSKLYIEHLNEYYVSEFDRDHEKYGYMFPHITPESFKDPKRMQDFYRWVKNDGTDIGSFDEAVEVCKSLGQHSSRMKAIQQMVFTPKSKKRKLSVIDTAMDAEEITYNIDELRSLSVEETLKMQDIYAKYKDQETFNKMLKRTYIDPVLKSVE